MSSSVNEGVGEGAMVGGGGEEGRSSQSLPQSPAPPAISPLTEPTDPGNREPSVNVNLDADPEQEGDLDHVPVTSTSTSFPSGTAPFYVDNYSHLKTEPQDLENLAQDLSYPDPLMDLDPATMEIYQQSRSAIWNRLAQMAASNAQFGLPPSTVRPSQVSLPQSLLDTADNALQEIDNASAPKPIESPLESFARIEFADSVFQMTTYAVIIGRDQRALQQARRDERREEEYLRRVFEAEQQGLPPPSPPTHEPGKFSKSYVSNEGGMLGPESDGSDDNPRPAKKRKVNNGSASDSQQHEATGTEPTAEDDKNLIVNRQYVSHTPGAAAVNLNALRPSPHHVPFIGIHSPGPNISSRTKAISREHLKIQFNQKEGVFEAIPLHKNGFFCADVHYKDEKVILKSGDILQIKDVDFTFIINGVPKGSTGAEWYNDEDEASTGRKYSEGGKEMSFDFESSHDVERRSTSVEEEDVKMEDIKEDSQSELSDVAEEDLEQDEDDNEVMDTIEDDGEERTPQQEQHDNELEHENQQQDMRSESEILAGLPFPPKKRGPGRPPKNGVMSKREERLRKKAALELAKKNAPPPPPGEPPIKRKVGRPRKHPLPEDGGERPEKRKYKPRKSKNGEEGEGSEGEKAVKEKRREKPKTPPLELRREEYTEEQLQKPNKNYGVLIDEVLSAAPDGLTLKQIYKRIQMKYPFYYFTVDTKGWESSVRHNLIGNDAFKKNEETHLWSRVPGIDIDAGKKRKATSPDHASALHNYGQQHYQTPMAPHAGVYHGNHASQQSYHPNVAQQQGYANHGQIASGQNPQQPQHFPRPAGQAGVPAQQPLPRPAYPAQAPGQKPPTGVPGYGAPAGAPRPLQAGAAQTTSYSSPYSTKPTSSHVAPPGATPHSMARQLSQPANGARPPNGLPRVDSLTGHPGAHGGRQTPAAAPPLPLEPAVPPELLKLVNNFKTLVTDQLQKRSKAPLLVAMSAINRGLGLSTKSIVPEEEGLELIVLGVFETSKKSISMGLHPNLLQALLTLKKTMIEILESKLGPGKSECLFLSATNRALGFIDQSIMQGNEAERHEYEKAENVLKGPLEKALVDHQRLMAAGAIGGPRTPTPAASTPVQASTPSYPARTSAPVHTPVHTPVQPQQVPVQAHAQAPLPPVVQTSAQPQPHAPASAHVPIQAQAPAPAPAQAQAQARGVMPSPARVVTPAPAFSASHTPTPPSHAPSPRPAFGNHTPSPASATHPTATPPINHISPPARTTALAAVPPANHVSSPASAGRPAPIPSTNYAPVPMTTHTATPPTNHISSPAPTLVAGSSTALTTNLNPSPAPIAAPARVSAPLAAAPAPAPAPVTAQAPIPVPISAPAPPLAPVPVTASAPALASAPGTAPATAPATAPVPVATTNHTPTIAPVSQPPTDSTTAPTPVVAAVANSSAVHNTTLVPAIAPVSASPTANHIPALAPSHSPVPKPSINNPLGSTPTEAPAPPQIHPQPRGEIKTGVPTPTSNPNLSSVPVSSGAPGLSSPSVPATAAATTPTPAVAPAPAETVQGAR